MMEEINYELIIACTAILLSLWAIFTTRKHNKISVKPKLDFVFNQDKNDNIITCKIRNHGLGPAILSHEIKIYYNGNQYDSIQTIFFQFYKNIWINEIDWGKNKGVIINEGVTLPVNGELPIYELHIKNIDDYDKILSITNNIKFENIYKDMYNKKYINRSH